MSKDQIFRDTAADPGSFQFNEAVADVFPDMLRRSIPGYDATIEAIGMLAARHARAGSRLFDLGSSLGAATLAMRRNIDAPGCRIIAVDAADAMVERCRRQVDADSSTVPVSVISADIRDVDIENASMVVLNYTLQFLPVEDRAPLLKKIGDGLIEGGVLVLSEKVADEDPAFDDALIDLHHAFKRANAYSELEIARKRTALENVLIPETTATHLERLSAAGFSHSGVWLKYFNFLSILAIR